jgi:hypothetical protein
MLRFYTEFIAFDIPASETVQSGAADVIGSQNPRTLRHPNQLERPDCMNSKDIAYNSYNSRPAGHMWSRDVPRMKPVLGQEKFIVFYFRVFLRYFQLVVTFFSWFVHREGIWGCQAFLTPSLERYSWSPSRFGRFTPCETASGIIPRGWY